MSPQAEPLAPSMRGRQQKRSLKPSRLWTVSTIVPDEARRRRLPTLFDWAMQIAPIAGRVVEATPSVMAINMCWLTDDETERLGDDLGEVLRTYAAQENVPGRRRVRLSTLIPDGGSADQRRLADQP